MLKKASWPRVLKFHGKRFQVRLVSEEALAKDHKENVPLADFDYDSDGKTIRVWRGLDHEARWTSLLHEILHLSFYLAHGRDGTEGSIEERLIEKVDQVLYEILSTNFGFGYKEVKKVRSSSLFGTRSGYMFDLLNPDENMISIEEIAHCLSYECRYNGQIPGENFLSVAEHSVAVCERIQSDVESGSVNAALIALLHDAHETYTGDTVAPLKKLIPEIKEVEEGIQKAILRKFGIEEVSEKTARVVKRADCQINELEVIQFAILRDGDGDEGVSLRFLPPEKAKKLFMGKFKEVYVARTQEPN